MSALKAWAKNQNEYLGNIKYIQGMELAERLYLKYIQVLQCVQVVTSETDIYLLKFTGLLHLLVSH